MSDALSNLYTDKGPLPLEYTQGPEYDSANLLIGGSMDDRRQVTGDGRTTGKGPQANTLIITM